MTIADRILARCMPIPECGCLVYLGAWTGSDYGSIKYQCDTLTTHRAVWESINGPLPPELDLDHLCRVRPCCNVDHLEPVTRRVNILRGVGIAANNVKKTHCIQGHALIAENTYGRPGRFAERDCLICRRERSRRYEARRRARRSAQQQPKERAA